MTKARKKFRPVTSKDVCLIYELLHREKLISFPISAEGKAKTDALVANINNVYFGRSIYNSPELKATAYLYFIIKDHPFVDGNKRTATLTFEIVCALNDLSPKYEGFTLDEIAVFLEKTQEEDHQNVIRTISDLLFNS